MVDVETGIGMFGPRHQCVHEKEGTVISLPGVMHKKVERCESSEGIVIGCPSPGKIDGVQVFLGVGTFQVTLNMFDCHCRHEWETLLDSEGYSETAGHVSSTITMPIGINVGWCQVEVPESERNLLRYGEHVMFNMYELVTTRDDAGLRCFRVDLMKEDARTRFANSGESFSIHLRCSGWRGLWGWGGSSK